MFYVPINVSECKCETNLPKYDTWFNKLKAWFNRYNFPIETMFRCTANGCEKRFILSSDKTWSIIDEDVFYSHKRKGIFNIR
jgi:hypothetical protein